MDVLYDIKDLLCKQLEEIAEKNDITPTELEMTYKAVDVMKDIETIFALKDAGYSYASSYDDGMMSYKRDSRGRYSRDNYRTSNRYSRADEKEHMLMQINELQRKIEQM